MMSMLNTFVAELVRELRSRAAAHEKPIIEANDPRRHDPDMRLASQIFAGVMTSIAIAVENAWKKVPR